MITENYVSFEVAKLLKEKGFNEGCSNTYNIYNGFMSYSNYNIKSFDIWCPTLQMTMKWLRELFNIHISLTPTFTEDAPYWYNASIYQVEAHRFRNKHFREHFNTYEQACESAITYCLINWL